MLLHNIQLQMSVENSEMINNLVQSIVNFRCISDGCHIPKKSRHVCVIFKQCKQCPLSSVDGREYSNKT